MKIYENKEQVKREIQKIYEKHILKFQDIPKPSNYRHSTNGRLFIFAFRLIVGAGGTDL